ncbi:MAG: CBS domain-containing protein [Roseiflexaceae bacterium]
MKVREIMTADVISVREDQEIEDAARVLARHRISGLPVLSINGAVVGLVTELDLISRSGRTVGDVMSRGVISVSPDTEIETLVTLLTDRRIRRVPVLEGDRLVGIVSRSDLVRQIAMRWVCHTCGERLFSATAPEQCPRCGAGSDAFSQLNEMPGM